MYVSHCPRPWYLLVTFLVSCDLCSCSCSVCAVDGEDDFIPAIHQLNSTSCRSQESSIYGQFSVFLNFHVVVFYHNN